MLKWLQWDGLMADESRKMRLMTFLAILLICVSMTFMQLGFVGVGVNGDYSAYILALLGPIACASLLLGSRWGCLEGLLAGAILYGHSFVMPLGLIEWLLMTPLNTIALYATTGLLIGLLFAIGLRKKPKGIRRVIAILLPCLLLAVLAAIAFAASLANQMENVNSIQLLVVAVSTGSEVMQAIFDFVLMSLLCIVVDRAMSYYRNVRDYASVRLIVRVRLIGALFLSFLAISSFGFVVITYLELSEARDSLNGELEYIQGQFEKHEKYSNELLSRPETNSLPQDMQASMSDALSVAGLVDGYDLSDGTLTVYVGDDTIYTDNEFYNDVEDILKKYREGEQQGKRPVDDVREATKKISATGDMSMMVYVSYNNSDNGEVDLGYMRAVMPRDSLYIMLARPSSMIFASRSVTMLWTSLSTFALLVVVYLFVSRILHRTVISPVERTNASLGKITMGDLNEMVTETGSVEFASLSAGINTCVDALKEYAAESARRIERDLATARAIQEGALPRVFPAFPGIDSVDLYASMDAAKEVGGDFYDFFPIDDDTVGFLIADVSGKGIPGALFMMAAKTEIGNRMQAGMELAEAISGANQYLCAHNEAGMFVTVWAATLKWKTGELTYVNAGHNFPLLRHGQGGTWEWLSKKCGLFLGTFDVAKYRQETLVLDSGDELVLYTDGVNEAFSVNEEEYGNDRLEEFLSTHADLRPQEMVEQLRADVAKWAEGAEQSDDVTILAVEYDLRERCDTRAD